MKYYRSPRTQQERRETAGLLPRPIIYRGCLVWLKTRPARSPSALPTYWDDKAPAETRSWKAYRHHQFK